MSHLQTFGAYIKELREKNGFSSQRQLAEKIGVSNSTVAKIERGTHEASDETLHKLAKEFGIDYIELVEKQLAGNSDDTDALVEKIKRLSRDQIGMVNNIVDEFLRLGGKA